MTRASIGRRTSDGTTGAAALELIAGRKGCWLRELTLSLVAATATTLGLGRPAAAGGTPTAPVRFMGEESGAGDGAFSATAIAWAVGPTLPTNFYRRAGFPATINAGTTWFLQSLFIPAGSTLVLWNLAANSLLDVTLVIDEQ